MYDHDGQLESEDRLEHSFYELLACISYGMLHEWFVILSTVMRCCIEVVNRTRSLCYELIPRREREEFKFLRRACSLIATTL